MFLRQGLTWQPRTHSNPDSISCSNQEKKKKKEKKKEEEEEKGEEEEKKRNKTQQQKTNVIPKHIKILKNNPSNPQREHPNF